MHERDTMRIALRFIQSIVVHNPSLEFPRVPTHRPLYFNATHTESEFEILDTVLAGGRSAAEVPRWRLRLNRVYLQPGMPYEGALR